MVYGTHGGTVAPADWQEARIALLGVARAMNKDVLINTDNHGISITHKQGDNAAAYATLNGIICAVGETLGYTSNWAMIVFGTVGCG